jgi:hypothetical protein
MRLLAQPKDPTAAVCRFLLKMGLEMLHEDQIANVNSPRFGEARQFARVCAPGTRWWFALIHSYDDDIAGLAIRDLYKDDFVFMIYGAGTTLLCPLVPNIAPSLDEYSSDFRIRYFRCL